MKKIILMIMFFCIIINVTAVQEKVYVLNFHYEDEKISLEEMIIKEGFSPDRKVEKGNHSLVLLDEKENIVDSIEFDVPLIVYTDIGSEDGISGGVIKLNETDFSLVIPYEKTSKEILIYDEKNEMVLREELVKDKGFPWVYVIGGLILLFIVVFMMINKRKEQQNY